MTGRWLTGNDARVARRYLAWSVVLGVLVLVGGVVGDGSRLEETLLVGVALGAGGLATVQAYRNAGLLVSVAVVALPLLAYFGAGLTGLLDLPGVDGAVWALATTLFLGGVVGVVGYVIGFGTRVARHSLGR